MKRRKTDFKKKPTLNVRDTILRLKEIKRKQLEDKAIAEFRFKSTVTEDDKCFKEPKKLVSRTKHDKQAIATKIVGVSDIVMTFSTPQGVTRELNFPEYLATLL